MDLKQFEKPFQGEIIQIEFDIRRLREMNRTEALRLYWVEHRASNTPVILKCPFMKTNVWKHICLTNIYLTCDSGDRDIEFELRNILAPQPNIFQKIYIFFHNLCSKETISVLEQLFPQPSQIRFARST